VKRHDIWLDLTTLKHWNRPAVGIVRVESEVCRLFLQQGDPSLRFCVYHRNEFRFEEIERDRARAWLDRIDNFSTLPAASTVTSAPAPAPPPTLVRRVARHLVMPVIERIEPDLRLPLINRMSRQLTRAERGWARLSAKRATSTAQPGTPVPSRTSPAMSFSFGDVYVSLGLDWDYKHMHHLYVLKRDYGVRHVLMCYDLIPYLFPHLCVGDVAAYFAKYFADLCWSAHHVLCISRNSQRDLVDLTREIDVPAPPTSVLKLGSEMRAPELDKVGPVVRGLMAREFVLFVSTIERRKNHEVVYRALLRLLEAGEDPPLIVFVGMVGWGVADLMSDLRLDERVNKRIVILDRVNDDELAVLYQHCLFTLYPSLYEGWGLPVAEALAFGKFCVASRTSSIPEVGGDLIDYCDPWNAQEWADTIRRYVQDRASLAARSRRIQQDFRSISWEETAATILQVARANA
jgi:glycosyltransferase involved in cell wall biosynthesis